MGDRQEEENPSVDHHFTFPFTKEELVSNSMKQFIEFRVLDHSDSFCRKKKYLLGHVLHPVDALPKFENLEAFSKESSVFEGIFKNYRMNDILDKDADNKDEQLALLWDELMGRQDEVACNFMRAQYNMETLSIN